MKYNNFLTLSVSILIVIILSTVSCENNTEKNDLIVYNFKSLDGQKLILQTTRANTLYYLSHLHAVQVYVQ